MWGLVAGPRSVRDQQTNLDRHRQRLFELMTNCLPIVDILWLGLMILLKNRCKIVGRFPKRGYLRFYMKTFLLILSFLPFWRNILRKAYLL